MISHPCCISLSLLSLNRRYARFPTFLLVLSLFLLNGYICRGLSGVEYLRHMLSIEGSFIGMSRYAMEHWRDLTWFPVWYTGMPYANVYPPLLSWGVAFVATVSGFTAAHAFHWVTAAAYCLGPVALFALALRLTGSRWTAFIAGLLYSTVSWSALLIPEIARDLQNPLNPRRLEALVLYGEAPHIASLTLLPVALLLLDLALSKRSAPWYWLASFGLAATVLTSWLGGYALALMILSYLVARLGWPPVPDLGSLVRMAGIGIAAYFVAMPWALPSTIAATQFNSKTLGGDFRGSYHTLPIWAAAVLLGLIVLKFGVRRLTPHLQFAIFFTFLLAALVFPFEWWQVSAVPQPMRYHLELEMAISLVTAFAAYDILKRFPRRTAMVAIALTIIALIQPVRMYRRYARNLLIRSVDITTTIEYRTAQWLNQNWTGGRVMMPGSTSIWLTAFTDTPELAGGPEQGVIDYMARVGIYGIYYGTDFIGARNGETSVVWLKALGVHAVGVSGPASSEVYKPFRNPKQFEGLLDPLWRDGDDVIYRVGAEDISLAHVVPRSSIVSRTPDNGIDVDPLRPYVSALDNPQLARAKFRWTSQHSANIAAEVQAGQAISIQEAWHRGWHATANGAAIPIERDAIGFMYIQPPFAGPVSIQLLFDGGTEAKVARWLSLLTVLLLAVASARAILKKSW